MDLEQIKSKTTWAEASGTMNNNNAKITEAIERLESAVENGTGGGVADSVAWKDVTNKPAWITDSKPVYNKTDLSESVQSSLGKADTALQSIPDGYTTDSELQNQIGQLLAMMSDMLELKVDKVEGKQLSTEDFTTALKTKLEALEGFDASQIEADVQQVKNSLQTILTGTSEEKIDSFADIILFFDGISQGGKLSDLLNLINLRFEGKQDVIDNLSNIESGAALGATAVQPNKLSPVAFSGSYNDLANKPTIPSAITPSIVQGWGFYTKPSDGIPAADLSEDVVNALDKANSALQAVPDNYTTDEELKTKLREILELFSNALSEKVDKIEGKQLSTEDFTTALKEKLERLTESAGEIELGEIREQLNTIMYGGNSGVIDSFADMIIFLNGISDSVDLKTMIELLRESINRKQDIINDLNDIRAGAAKGNTAVQPDVLAGYLPLSGGTIKGNSSTPLVVDSNHATETGIRILRNGAIKSIFGYNDNVGTWMRDSQVGKNIVISIDGELRYGHETDLKKVWHEGNFDPLTYKAPSAVSSDSTSILKGIVTTDFSGSDLNQELKIFTRIPYGTEGLFPCEDNANAVLILNRHTGNYNSQIGFNSRGEVYYRSGNTQVLGTQAWKQIAFTDTKVDNAINADYATSSGNADSAVSAIQDGSGNVITSTYATKEELSSKTNGDGVFIMFHRNSDNFPLMVKPEKWKRYQDSGEIAEGVMIVEGGRMLVVAPTETSLYWSGATVSGGGKFTTDRQLALIDFEGKANTKQQITHAECSGENYASGYCALYSKVNANGKGLDAGKWWLPSMGEMMIIYANRDKINYALSFISGATQLAENWYWSSTEYSAANAWFLNLSYGNASYNTKATGQSRVRPVSASYNTENTTIMPWSDIVSSPNLSEFTSKLTNVASAVFATSAGDSDTLNGLSSDNFARYFKDTTVDANTISDGIWGGKGYASTNMPLGYYAFLSVGTGKYKMQFNSGGNKLYFRSGNEAGLEVQPWKQIAFTDTKVDAAVSADSASKLATAQNIFGNQFDGTTGINRIYSDGGKTVLNYTEEAVSIGNVKNDFMFVNGKHIYMRSSDTTDLAISPSGDVDVTKNLSIGGNETIGGNLTVRGNIIKSNVIRDENDSSLIGRVLTEGSKRLSIGDANISESVKIENQKGYIFIKESGSTEISGLLYGKSGLDLTGVLNQRGGECRMAMNSYVDPAPGFSGALKMAGGFAQSGGNVILGSDSGNVLIGTTTDSGHRLSVNGTASISGDISVSGTSTLRDVRMSEALAIRMGVGTTISEDYALSVGGDVSVSGYVMTEGVSMYSQRSLKDVVDEEGLSLEELATIKPTRFTWKDGRDERVHIGGIADDVQKVLPEAVRETPEGILTMDYPVASFAVASSLVKPVTDHEERIAELERENKQLREELEMIKRYIGYGNDKQ